MKVLYKVISARTHGVEWVAVYNRTGGVGGEYCNGLFS